MSGNTFPIRTCTKCSNVLIFTYTCHSDASQDLGGMTSALRNGHRWKFTCRACGCPQYLMRNEVVCTREGVCRLLNTRESLLKTVLPKYPRPRSLGQAGKVEVRDLLAIANRPEG